MAEAVVVSSAPSIAQHVNRDRLFYSGMAVAMALVAFAGFARTYYLPMLGSGQPTTFGGFAVSPLVHLHGLLFTGWVLLFITQTALVATRRVRVHQRLGIAGAALAASMIVAGVSLAIAAAAAGMAPPGVEPLTFLAIPLGDMVLFAALVGSALWQRRNREAHKRLMLLAYVSLLAAPVARLPGVLPLGPFGFFGLAFVFIVLGVAYDVWSRRRVHPVYIWGGLALVLSVPLRLILSGTAAWQAFAAFLTS
ncbi:MAG TPA: hypothetical protein VMM93_07530 [Vicinamibacterales bacterium]|nr:hypothetical protein [Vicinamibacterales bacterium]